MPEKFTSPLYVRCPPSMTDLIEKAATSRYTTVSDYARCALVDRLQADGFHLPPTDAGSLYNVLSDGQRMFALIVDGQIAAMSYSPEKPDDGQVWFPVEYEDSQLFDSGKHYRLAPVNRIEGDRVVRTYPVVLKTEEPG